MIWYALLVLMLLAFVYSLPELMRRSPKKTLATIAFAIFCVIARAVIVSQ